MINYDEIGLRIYLARKRRRLSQERMAEDLGLYQADISNLEKNKKGSGITDLSRLETIADYFGMPLTQLLLGTSGTDVEPEKEGNEMDNEKKIRQYKELLAFEGMLGNSQPWNDSGEDESTLDWMREQLEELHQVVCRDEFEIWKKEYLDSEYQKYKDRSTLITVVYEVSGGEKYRETLPQDHVGWFLNMIEEREDLLLCSLGNASEEDLRQFLAESAYDEEEREPYFTTPEGRRARVAARERERALKGDNGPSWDDFPDGYDGELPFD